MIPTFVTHTHTHIHIYISVCVCVCVCVLYGGVDLCLRSFLNPVLQSDENFQQFPSLSTISTDTITVDNTQMSLNVQSADTLIDVIGKLRRCSTDRGIGTS
jgi:hypothetical protein